MRNKLLISEALILSALIFIIPACEKANNDEADVRENIIDFQIQEEVADEMIALYDEYLQNDTEENSRFRLVEDLKSSEYINDAGISEDGTTVWWEYTDGLEFYYLTETSLSKSDSTFTYKNVEAPPSKSLDIISDQIFTKNESALILSPYSYEFSWFDTDETKDIESILDNMNYNITYKLNANTDDNNLSISDYEQFNNYGVIAISTHGGVSKDGQIFINSGVPITEELKNYLKEHIDEKRVSVAYSKHWLPFTQHKVVALKSSWFDAVYNQNLNNSLVYIGACKGYFNQSLSNALIGNNSAFFGWTNDVSLKAVKLAAIDLFGKLAEGANVKDAYNHVVENGNTIDDDATFKKSSNSQDDLELLGADKTLGWYKGTYLIDTIYNADCGSDHGKYGDVYFYIGDIYSGEVVCYYKSVMNGLPNIYKSVSIHPNFFDEDHHFYNVIGVRWQENMGVDPNNPDRNLYRMFDFGYLYFSEDWNHIEQVRRSSALYAIPTGTGSPECGNFAFDYRIKNAYADYVGKDTPSGITSHNIEIINKILDGEIDEYIEE